MTVDDYLDSAFLKKYVGDFSGDEGLSRNFLPAQSLGPYLEGVGSRLNRFARSVVSVPDGLVVTWGLIGQRQSGHFIAGAVKDVDLYLRRLFTQREIQCLGLTGIEIDTVTRRVDILANQVDQGRVVDRLFKAFNLRQVFIDVG